MHKGWVQNVVEVHSSAHVIIVEAIDIWGVEVLVSLYFHHHIVAEHMPEIQAYFEQFIFRDIG